MHHSTLPMGSTCTFICRGRRAECCGVCRWTRPRRRPQPRLHPLPAGSGASWRSALCAATCGPASSPCDVVGPLWQRRALNAGRPAAAGPTACVDVWVLFKGALIGVLVPVQRVFCYHYTDMQASAYVLAGGSHPARPGAPSWREPRASLAPRAHAAPPAPRASPRSRAAA